MLQLVALAAVLMSAPTLPPDAAPGSPVAAPGSPVAAPGSPVTSASGDGFGWTAPEGCPDAQQARAAVRGLQAPGHEPHIGDSVEVVVELAPRGYEAVVTLHTDRGHAQRVLVASDCTLLSSAVALVVAVQLDALAAVASEPVAQHLGRQLAPDPASVPPPGAQTRLGPTPPPETPPPSPVFPTRKSSLRGAIRVEGGGGFGELPEFGPRVSLLGALLIRRWRVEFGAAYAVGGDARLPAPDDDTGADLVLWTGRVRAGFVPRVRIVEFPLHLGFELGDMVGEGTGVDASRTRHAFWAAVEAAAGVGIQAGPNLAFWVQGAGTLALRRPRYGIDLRGDVTEVHEARLGGVRVVGGVEVRFP